MKNEGNRCYNNEEHCVHTVTQTVEIEPEDCEQDGSEISEIGEDFQIDVCCVCGDTCET